MGDGGVGVDVVAVDGAGAGDKAVAIESRIDDKVTAAPSPSKSRAPSSAPVNWMSTTTHDVAKDGARATSRGGADREHFRSSSEFSRYVDECIRRHLDPLGTGH